MLIVLFSVWALQSIAQDSSSRWVDSVYNGLSPAARIGQLFMVPLSPLSSQDEINRVTNQVKGTGIGGLYITGGGPNSHIRLLNKLQENSRVPLLVGTSAEWGLAQSMDSTMSFQMPMVAAACADDSLYVLRTREIARQMKRLGIHINFAPNADDEIFAGDYLRYSGNNLEAVTRRSVTFTSVMQSEGILSVAKHLPKKAVPSSIRDSTLILSLNKIDTGRLHVFQSLVDSGVHGILTSYLHYSIQNEKGIIPASASQVFISEILKKKLDFRGLIYTDVNNFQQVSRKRRAGDAELLAFEAGSDVMMSPLNIPAATKKIIKRIKKDKALQQQLEVSVKRILSSKYGAGLHHRTPISPDNLHAQLSTPEARWIKRAMADVAVTLVRNEKDLLPIQALNNNTFLCLSVGQAKENEFTRYLKKYAPFETNAIRAASDTSNVSVKPSDIVIIGIFPYVTDLEKQLAPYIRRLGSGQKVIVVHFSNPLSLGLYDEMDVLLAAYTDQDYAMEVAPQLIFGALPANGTLPVSINHSFPQGTGLHSHTLDRIGYSVPEAVGMNSAVLDKIDGVVKEAIDTKATPGCQVVVIKSGKVVYEKAYGWQTYENKLPVTDETIYDLASLTKVLGTVQTVMHLQEMDLIDLNKKAAVYLPELQATNKKDIILKDILTHQAGLLAFIPLWPQTMDEKNGFLPLFYSRNKSEGYPLQVAPELFATPSIRDSLWNWMVQSKMVDKPPRTPYTFRYSDLGPWILYRLSEKILNQHMEDFLQQFLYSPIGAGTTGYLPLNRFDVSLIAPTENDTLFRKTMVVGTVHDERAALLGGVAGHAGLFSNANDVAKLGQMLLQKGAYGGQRYFKPETVALFTDKQFETSRRGLGWDKPIQGEWNSPTSLYASPETFGHTGFTGTCLWVDPEFDLVFVFLSNRVFPDRSNKLNATNIRSRIQDIIYRSIFDFCLNQNPASWSK